VRAEGCAIIVLKRLSDAVANHDNILALFRGTAANQDGRSGGLTAPNGEAQQAVIREALTKSGLKPADISYLETHGTGTSLGDPIEVQSLGAVFSEDRPNNQPLLLGAVKSNIGHLEAAAGIAGLVKVILALQHKQIPPSLHVKELNPHIAWEKYPVKVTTELTPWPTKNGRRLAGVSSFGFSGTNVHVLVEEAPVNSNQLSVNSNQSTVDGQLNTDYCSLNTDHWRERPLHVLTLSAKSEAALKEVADRYERHLALIPPQSFKDVCFTANAGRMHFNHRLALTVESLEQAREKLAAFIAGQTLPGMQTGKVEEGSSPEIAFLFTGQGAQYIGMGRRLYETQPIFRAALDKCDEILRPYLEKPLLSVLYSEMAGGQHDTRQTEQKATSKEQKTKFGSQHNTPRTPLKGGISNEQGATSIKQPATSNEQPATSNELDQTAYTQPALFAIEYALAELWRSWGIAPTMVMGHSVGEYVAACVAGVFSLEDGLKLIAARGRMMQALPQNGSMVAVFAEEEKVNAAIAAYSDKVSIAAINGPTNIAISGEREAVSAIIKSFESAGIKSKPLSVSHAFHSPLLEPMLDEFGKIAGEIKHGKPRMGFISNLTGQLFDFVFNDPQSTIPEPRSYWRCHAREAVRFSEGINTLVEQGCKIFIEIGPSPTLLSMGQRCLPEDAATAAWLPSLRKGREDWQSMLETLASLYVHGVNIDWAKYDRDYARRRVILPTYPFQRARYWARAAEQNRGSRSSSFDLRSSTLHPLLGQRLRSALQDIQFEAQISLETLPFLNDHQFYGLAVLPATAYLEMALASAMEAFGPAQHCIEKIDIHEALFLPEGAVCAVQLILTPQEAGTASFKIYSLDEAGDTKQSSWKLHTSGVIGIATTEATIESAGLAEIQKRCPQTLAVDSYYEKLSKLGVDYGPSFQGLVSISRGNNEALGQICLPDSQLSEAEAFQIHPALLDACFQLVGAALHGENQESAEEAIYMPVGLDRLQVHRSKSSKAWGHVQLRESYGKGSENIVADLHVLADDGQIIAEVEGLHFKRARREALLRVTQKQLEDGLYEMQWQPQTLAESRQISKPAQPSNPRRWLIFADQHGVAVELAQQLKKQNETCVLIFAGERFDRSANDGWRINPSRREDFDRILKELCSDPDSDCRVVHLWSLQAEVAPEASLAELLHAEKLVCESVLLLVQALAHMSFSNSPRLWLITRNAKTVGSQTAPPALAQASLWGLSNVIDLEHSALQCVRIDLDLVRAAGEVSTLCEELQASTRENQIAFRGNQRYVARLAVCKPENREASSVASVLEERPVKLEIASRGMLDNLQLVPLTRRSPQRGEVEVRVLATGLNFRDVLNALGMYPGDPGPLGNECIGKIVALGEEVEGLEIDDEVMVLAADSFASYVTIAAKFVIPKPKHLSTEESATLPITFLTAQYALNHLAGMSAGDRVLIHAAAGGVGLAAIQLAQRAGAEIFATAGSPEKHEYLRMLGIKHIMSSRHLAFAEEIMKATNGEGVDIVLNSLAGEFIPKSLSLLRSQGRFLEIGKTEVWNENKVKALKPEVAYHVIYLGQTIQEQPELIRALFLELSSAFESGELKPLPFKSFPLEDAAHAYRYMAQARHIGKIVLTQRAVSGRHSAEGIAHDNNRGAKFGNGRSKIEDRASNEQPASSNQHPASSIQHRASSIRSNATYLITGGLGALGLKVAEWLVAKGARHLVLAGRKAPTEEASAVIAKMKNASANVVVMPSDISQEKEVERILSEIAQSLPPLRGIMHSAGVLDDGILLQQDWPRFAKVMAPKVEGSWHLHRLTKDLPLDFFVLFSSIAAMFGASGQGNYAAANAFMDALAHYRRARGLPATSINWGPWAEAGMAADLGKRGEQRMTQSGISLITPEQGMQMLEQVLGSARAQVAILPITWSKFLKQFPMGKEPPLFLNIVKETRPAVKADMATVKTVNFVQELERALPAERPDLLMAHVREQAVKVLGLEPSSSIELQQPLNELGLDSLMAVELRNALSKSVEQSLPGTLLFDYPTIDGLVGYLAKDVLGWESSAKPAEATHKPNDEGNGVLAEIKRLSEDEVEASIAEELEKLMSMK